MKESKTTCDDNDDDYGNSSCIHSKMIRKYLISNVRIGLSVYRNNQFLMYKA